MSGRTIARPTAELFACKTVDQLRGVLRDHAEHFGFWSVGGWSDTDELKDLGAHDRGSFAWDTFGQHLGNTRAADFRAAIESSDLFGTMDEAVDRLDWSASQKRPFLYVSDSPRRFGGFLERFQSRSKDFGVAAAECLILPTLDQEAGRGRMFAGVEGQPSAGDTVAMTLLLTNYRYMSDILQASDRPDDPIALPDRGADRPVELTANEREVLAWAAAGKTLHDIAVITGLKYRTVRFLMKRAQDRYGYATTTQTIVRAALDYDFDPLGAP